MADDLPQDTLEREIYLRALRDYSERCEAPELTADCPYSVDIEPGVRGCGEECMDLLGMHGAPRPSEEIDLGGGFSIRRTRRPRPRRRVATKAFDAREIYLEDEGSGPPSTWRLAAILQGLIEAARTPPSSDASDALDRRSHIDRLIRLTEQRGLDFEIHVLPHVRTAVAGAVFGNLVMARQHEINVCGFDPTTGWSSLADEYLGDAEPDSSVEALGEAFEPLLSPILAWALGTTADDLFDWTPPTRSLLEKPPVEAVGDPDEDGVWIVQRFTRTYLEQWSVPALRKEWLYLHGQYSAPCSSLDMSIREVSEIELAMVMADRLATDTPPLPQLAHSLVEPAVSFLTEGRRVEAAALFEAAVRR